MTLPKKSLSQNFLIDHNICKKIINQTKIENKIVLEIGPGYGSMTKYILNKNPKKLILVEKDHELVKQLHDIYKDNKKVKIIEKDFLKFEFLNMRNIIIISNLPYNVSTKIILYLLKNNRIISEMVLMIQKEVALKFDYKIKKMNKYKFLTYLLSTFSRCFDVSSKVFFPKPKIKSTVVKFKFNKNNINFEKANEFSKLIFKNVRKKIYNNIKKRKNENKLFSKRVNELTIEELLEIYNLF